MNTQVVTQGLYGGISTQDAHQRLPNQVEDAYNVHFSIRNGASKRPGTKFVGAVTSLLSSARYRMFPIVRDERERYLVIYGNGAVRVFEILSTGGLLEATVTTSGTASTYFGLNSATADDMRLLSIADATLIANTTVATATASGATFTVTSSWPTYDVLVSRTPADETYHSVTGGTITEYYKYDVDAKTFATATMRTNTFWEWSLPNNLWISSAPVGFKVAFQRRNMDITGGTWDESELTLTKTAAFTNYTYRTGDQVYVTGGTNITTGWHDIASKTNADTIVLRATIATDAADHSDVATDAIGRQFQVLFTPTSAPDMNARAKSIQDQLQAAGAVDALVSWTQTATYSGYFTITSPWRGSESKVIGTSAPSSGFDLSAGPIGSDYRAFSLLSRVDGTGTLASDADDVLPLASRWTEVGAPGEANASLDATKMPMLMRRTAYTGNGSTPATFSIDVASWAPRESGSATTNPAPTAFRDGDKITAMAFYRSRLVLGMSDWLVMSRVNDLFNFYIEEAETLADDDRIEVSIATDQVTRISWLVPLRSGLIVFTAAGGQFEVTDRDTLTPATIAVTPSTRIDAINVVQPQRIGGNLYFVGPKRDSAALYEYYYDDTRVTNDAVEVSLHAEGVIPTTVVSSAVSEEESTVLMLPTGCNEVIAYQMAWSGQQKVQSSLTRWGFHSSYTTEDIAAIGSTYYLLVDRGSNAFHIEGGQLGMES